MTHGSDIKFPQKQTDSEQSAISQHIGPQNLVPSGPDLARHRSRPLVSLIVPAYNEGTIIEETLTQLCQYLQGLEADYKWEVIVVNDGSSDNTGAIAECFSQDKSQVRVIHHMYNGGLGQAIQTGASASQGDYIVTVDSDLSYAPDHIERLLERIQQTRAKVVVASPYMPGGQVSNVPFFRQLFSVLANRFLSAAAKRRVTTLTSLMRVYDGDFLRSLMLLSPGMEVNPEALHKAVLLYERIDEIPAHLCWNTSREVPSNLPKSHVPRRKSSMKILRHTWETAFSVFIFRPVMFFVLPSLVFLGLSAVLSLIEVFSTKQTVPVGLASSAPAGLKTIFLTQSQLSPSAFFGAIFLLLFIQLFAMGLLAVQNKRYFEEMFCLGMATYRRREMMKMIETDQPN